MAPKLSADRDGPAGRAVDRCPYSRSFTAAFAEDPACPAYQGATFTVLDTSDRPLRPAVTCRHLVVGNHPHHAGRFYPRCGLGGLPERSRWVASVTPARVAVMRALEEEFEAATLADREALLAAKASLLHGDPDTSDVANLEVALSDFLDRVDAFIEERADRLADVGLTPTQVQGSLADWAKAWLRSGDLYGPRIDESVQRTGIAPVAAALLGAALDDPKEAVPAPDAVSTRAGALSVTRTENPRTLRLRGEIDRLTSHVVASALKAALADGSTVTVDLREVVFCDLSGLRALVHAAEGTAPGQDIHVTSLPAHLQRAARLVGWPGLTVGPRAAPPVDPIG